MGHSNTDDDVTTDSSSAAESGTSSTKTDSGIIEHEDDDDLSSDLCPFFVGEKVLAYHNTHIYEAKVINTQFHYEWRVLIHYHGWNKSWDEWVRLDRLLKYTDENREKQQLASKKDGTNKDPKPSRTQAKPTSHHGASGRKRKNHSAVEGAIVMDEFVIRMPPELREQLADDCQSVTHLAKIQNLQSLLILLALRICDSSEVSSRKKAHPLEEILKGLCCYFDKALPVMLLYKNERPQYEKAIVDNVSPSSVYGAEHLLRLYVKLPELLVDANIEEETLKELVQILVDFLKFLHKNQSAFFLSYDHLPEDTEISTQDHKEWKGRIYFCNNSYIIL